MRGQKTTEMELEVPVAEVWDLYGTLKLPRLMEERLPVLVEKINIDGDGGVGTLIHVQLTPEKNLMHGLAGLPFSYYKEKIIVLDNENHVKIMDVVEGGFLSLGFNLLRIRFEIIEKNSDSSIIRAITQYEIDDEFAAIAPPISNDAMELIAQASAAYLLQKKFEASLRDALPGDDSDEDLLSISPADEEMNGTARSVPPTAEEIEAGVRSTAPNARPPATEEIDTNVRSVRPQHTSAATK
ncbi:hypothetical protein ACLOJK_033912 [Asimina triloba]